MIIKYIIKYIQIIDREEKKEFPIRAIIIPILFASNKTIMSVSRFFDRFILL